MGAETMTAQMRAAAVLACCLLLVSCASYTEQQGILTVPTGSGSAPGWLWAVTALAVIALVVGIVLFIRSGPDE